MKLVYCVDRLFHVGGIEVTTSLKANALVNGGMASVWILYTEQKDATPFTISPGVHLVDLGIRYSDNTKPFPWNLICIILKKHRHKNQLTRALSQIRPDIVISTGGQEFRILPRIKGSWTTLCELHSTKFHKRILAQTWQTRLFARFSEWQNYKRTITQYDHIVVLTQEEKGRYWSDWNNVSVIPNPTRFQPDLPSELLAKRVLTVGRLSPEKNYSSLIRAFALVHPLFPDWSLDIFGDGDERNLLLSEIEDYHLNDVIHLPGSTNDVRKEMLASSLLVCSSKYEGFAMVILEAMSCGLPVVSYECPCGPKDLISDEYNGYLVPVGDEITLADRICRLIENTERRKQMGLAALETSKQFSLERITSLWMALFKKLIGEKRHE